MRKITVESTPTPYCRYRLEDYELFLTYVIKDKALQDEWRNKYLPNRFNLALVSKYHRDLLVQMHNDNIRKLGNYSSHFKEESDSAKS